MLCTMTGLLKISCKFYSKRLSIKLIDEFKTTFIRSRRVYLYVNHIIIIICIIYCIKIYIRCVLHVLRVHYVCTTCVVVCYCYSSEGGTCLHFPRFRRCR